MLKTSSFQKFSKTYNLFCNNSRFYSKKPFRMASKFQPVKIIMPTAKQTGTIFFFHGAGDTGPGIAEWVKALTGDKFNFPHLKIVFPTAPKIPYTAQGGEPTNIWYNYSDLDSENDQDRMSIKDLCEELKPAILEEAKNIPLDRVFFGGYSVGGAIALHLGYQYIPNVAGVFSLSSHIPNNSEFYKNIQSPSAKLFLSNGKNDDVILPEWSKNTFDNLQKAGVKGDFDTFDGKHELNKNELENLIKWIQKTVPN